MDKLKLDGKKYCVKFGQYVLLKFLRTHKIEQQQLSVAFQKDMVLMYDFIYSAVVLGEKMEGREFDMDFDLFCVALDDSSTNLEYAMELFAISQGVDPEEVNDKKK